MEVMCVNWYDVMCVNCDVCELVCPCLLGLLMPKPLYTNFIFDVRQLGSSDFQHY
jgi:ferredoxin